MNKICKHKNKPKYCKECYPDKSSKVNKCSFENVLDFHCIKCANTNPSDEGIMHDLFCFNADCPCHKEVNKCVCIRDIKNGDFTPNICPVHLLHLCKGCRKYGKQRDGCYACSPTPDTIEEEKMCDCPNHDLYDFGDSPNRCPYIIPFPQQEKCKYCGHIHELKDSQCEKLSQQEKNEKTSVWVREDLIPQQENIEEFHTGDYAIFDGKKFKKTYLPIWATNLLSLEKYPENIEWEKIKANLYENDEMEFASNRDQLFKDIDRLLSQAKGEMRKTSDYETYNEGFEFGKKQAKAELLEEIIKEIEGMKGNHEKVGNIYIYDQVLADVQLLLNNKKS